MEAINALVSLILRAVGGFDAVCVRTADFGWRPLLAVAPVVFLAVVEALVLVECFTFFADAVFLGLDTAEDALAARSADPHRPQIRQAIIILRRKQFA
jgi:hypothetical protein